MKRSAGLMTVFIISVMVPALMAGEPTRSVAVSRPVVVSTSPRAGDLAVDPNLSEIRVVFSKKMKDKCWSWCRADEGEFPEMTGQPRYLDDGRTCVLPVKLIPGTTYAVWINTDRFVNFKDPDGRPAIPYLIVFETE